MQTVTSAENGGTEKIDFQVPIISAPGLYPGEIYGAQFIYNIWYIYPRPNRTRTALIVSGINIDGMHIDIYDENPRKYENKKSEKILIKNLPATIPISVIMSYLKGSKGFHNSN